MAINATISLTAGMRANLISLQGTADLLNRTQDRLSSGKKVNSALDNPISYFAAKAHMSRANDIASLKDAMGEAIQTIKAADAGIESITSLIEQAKALGNSALGAAKNQVKIEIGTVTAGNAITIGGNTLYTATAANVTATSTQFNIADDAATVCSNLAAKINASAEGTDMTATASGTTLILEAKLAGETITVASNVMTTGENTVFSLINDVNGKEVFSERAALAESYKDIISQIDAIAVGSNYKGVNLLMDNDLNVSFEGTSLSVKGFSSTASDLNMATSPSTSVSKSVDLAWSVNSEIRADVGKLDNSISALRTEASKLSTNLNIINTQLNFSENLIETLTEGADKLTLADMNEEAANMLALQTQQALGATALSLSSQAAQSVLRLF